MKLLAFDTAYSACSVALYNAGNITVLHEIAPMKQAQLILPMIDQLLSSASLSLQDLDAIAYGSGPGSFTGGRIASSVAQGLSFATQKPLVRVSSLAALAQAAFIEQQEPSFLVAVDARMEQVYWAIYEANAEGLVELVGEEQTCHPDVISLPAHKQGCGIGDGWGKYADKLEHRLQFKPRYVDYAALPIAKAMLMLASKQIN